MNNNDILNDIDKKVLLGRQLGVFKNPLGQKLLQLYGNGILDPWAIGQINKRVDKQLRKEAFRAIPFKQPQLHSGELILGADEKHHPIKSPVQYMNAGSLLVANTGSGKTTLVSFYAAQIAHHVKGMWLVDLRKKEFRLLKAEFASRGVDLVIVRSRKFKINPLQVPYHVDPYEYASTIADVLVKVLNLPPRASVLLSSSIIKMYKEFNIFNGGQKYPTLFHLFEAVRNNRNANSQARQAILDNLEAILLAFGTEMLGYYRGWPVHELARLQIAFELAGQPEAGKDLVLNYLVVAELISRISQGISNRGMDLWMSIDEGQRLFSQRKESIGHGGNSITDLAGLVRGIGAGLFISVLTPDDLSNKIPAITSTKLMGRCGSIPEYHAAGQFMGLTKEQIVWCAHNMVPGMFVGQVSEGPWRYPFLFRVPKMKQLKVVADHQADESLKSLDSLDVEPVEFSGWSAVERIEVKDYAVHKTQKVVQLTDSEFRLLKAIVDNPMLSSSSYVKLARISPNTLKKLRPILIEKGFIVEHIMDSGNRGRSKRVWEPLDAGKQAITDTTI
ncbi:MAG: hypothetical protein FVQ84_20715 [Planctomycetes bacterium]|nr:hypothetical protein [Planctomycetota bacterium]